MGQLFREGNTSSSTVFTRSFLALSELPNHPADVEMCTDSAASLAVDSDSDSRVILVYLREQPLLRKYLSSIHSININHFAEVGYRKEGVYDCMHAYLTVAIIDHPTFDSTMLL